MDKAYAIKILGLSLLVSLILVSSVPWCGEEFGN